ncbi:MAG: cytochrome b/b6 domain-containing protein [Desulfobacterales bacterium]|nr:cytochrome b/b6 domain-containing protein [Desulfobacterales bacterium]MBS3754517.1 cytochrome b/b6 domain-containing protein [Desulfobacterales bacterium]
MENNDKKIYLYTRFERFWHWVQGLLIMTLILTGFEIHGAWNLLGFETAFTVHNFCAWSWLVLYVFIVFWMAITAEWKQYIPTYKKLFDVVRFYAYGIFTGEPHPVPKTTRAKHNPLQRLTYLGIVSFLVPFQIITGFLYYYYSAWPALGWDWALMPVALLHTVGAFAMLAFLIVHVYMTTTGPTVFAHIKSMFTGWEEVEGTAGHEWEIKK